MAKVLLRQGWPGEFRRSVRDEEGQILETLVFTPGEPRELDDVQLVAVAGDLVSEAEPQRPLKLLSGEAPRARQESRRKGRGDGKGAGRKPAPAKPAPGDQAGSTES